MNMMRRHKETTNKKNQIQKGQNDKTFHNPFSKFTSFVVCKRHTYLPLYGTSTTIGALIGEAYLSGQSIIGLLSPFLTVRLQVD